MRRFHFHEAVTVQFGEETDIIEPPQGLSHDDLQRAQRKFESAGCSCRFVHLHMLLPEMVRIVQGSRVDAHILLVRGGARALMGSDQACNDLLSEQLKLHVDKGENLHRILLKDDQIKLNRLRSALPNFFPSGIESLTTDAYKYFEPNKNGFSYQGSRQVICVNLGHSLKVDFHWFHQGNPEGKPFHASMDHGDIYILSTKAMGADWEKKGVYSVQHAMGAQKFRQLAKKKQVKKNLLLSRKRGPRRRIARAPQLRPPHPKSKPPADVGEQRQDLINQKTKVKCSTIVVKKEIVPLPAGSEELRNRLTPQGPEIFAKRKDAPSPIKSSEIEISGKPVSPKMKSPKEKVVSKTPTPKKLSIIGVPTNTATPARHVSPKMKSPKGKVKSPRRPPRIDILTETKKLTEEVDEDDFSEPLSPGKEKSKHAEKSPSAKRKALAKRVREEEEIEERAFVSSKSSEMSHSEQTVKMKMQKRQDASHSDSDRKLVRKDASKRIARKPPRTRTNQSGSTDIDSRSDPRRRKADPRIQDSLREKPVERNRESSQRTKHESESRKHDGRRREWTRVKGVEVSRERIRVDPEQGERKRRDPEAGERRRRDLESSRRKRDPEGKERRRRDPRSAREPRREGGEKRRRKRAVRQQGRSTCV